MKRVKPLIDLDRTLEYEARRLEPRWTDGLREWCIDLYESANRYHLTLILGIVIVVVSHFVENLIASWFLSLLGRLTAIVGCIALALERAGLIKNR